MCAVVWMKCSGRPGSFHVLFYDRLMSLCLGIETVYLQVCKNQ